MRNKFDHLIHMKKDCIEKYKEELLRIIADFYNENDSIRFPSLYVADRKSFFVDTQKTLNDIKEVERMPLYRPNLGILKNIPKNKSGKPDNTELKKYIALKKRKKKERLASLRGICMGQHKKWVERCTGFVRVMDKDVLPYLETSSTSPLFRFKFFDEVQNHEHLEKDLVDRTALSIFSCFMSYLKYLRNVVEYDKDQAVQIVKEKMHSYENDYLPEYGDDFIIPSHCNDNGKNSQMVVPFPEKGIDWDNVKWEDVKIIIRVESKEIDISINGSKQMNYHYSQMGFKQKCIDKPTKAWSIFLCFARADNNVLSLNTLKRFNVNMKLQAFQDRISEIRKNVRALFPNLPNDPIPHKKAVGYRPKFIISAIVNGIVTTEFSAETDNIDYQSKVIVNKNEV